MKRYTPEKDQVNAQQIINYLQKQVFKRAKSQNVRAELNLNDVEFSRAMKLLQGRVNKERIGIPTFISLP